MKLVVIYDEKPEHKLLPRDIRNIMGSLTKDEPEVNKLVMWHERKQPPLIYTLPTYSSFAIISYLETDEVKNALEFIKNKLKKDGALKLSNSSVKIKNAYIADYHYTRFSEGFYERKLKSPMVLGASAGEYARARELSKDGVDIEKLKSFAVDTIKESIRFQNRDWFNKEDFEVDDIMIMFKDIRYTVVKYKDNENYPAVFGTIISNRNLPDFIGYKCGMGYGELLRAGKK